MTFLLAWTLRAAATIVLGLLLALALRRRSAATRSLVLRATLGVSLTLPLLASFAPRVEVDAPAVALPPAALTTPLPHADSAPTPVAQGWSVEADEAARPATYGLARRAAVESRLVWGPALILALWASGSGLLLLRWLAGLTRLLLVRRRATRTDAPDVWRAAVPVPATYGRTVLLPLESEAWPEARRRAAILHERAHVARRDWAWQTLAALFAALHWPNPLTWLLVRALRDTAEAAADDAALAHMAPSDYARELLAVAKAAGRVGPALAMARRGGVRDRVVSVLASGRERRGPTARAGVLLLASVGLCGIVVAGIVQSRESSVRLLDVSDRSGAHWDLAGHRVFASGLAIDGKGLGVPKGFRWVTMRLDLGGSQKGHGVRIEVPPPVWTNGYGPTDSEGQPVLLSVVAPDGLRRTNVRIGVAEGDWRDIPGSGSFRRTVERIAGGNDPQYSLGVDFPARYMNEQVRIVARLRNGTEPKIVGTGSGYEDAFFRRHGSPEATIHALGHPSDVLSVVLQHRPYRWTTLRNVALRPEPATEETKGPSVRIVAVQQVDVQGSPSGLQDRRVWSPNGASLPAAQRSTVLDDRPSPVGHRRMMLQVAVEGDPSAVAAKLLPWGVHSSTRALRSPDPRLAVLWDAPADRTSQDVRLAMASGPWKPYRGDLHFAARRLNEAWLRFDFPDSLVGKNVQLHAVLRDGRRVVVARYNFGPDGPTPFRNFGDAPRQGYPFPQADDVRRIEIEYRDYKTAVFPKVALSPIPALRRPRAPS